MGWTATDYRVPGETHRQFFEREVIPSESRIIDSAFIDRTFYAAVQNSMGCLTCEGTGLVNKVIGRYAPGLPSDAALCPNCEVWGLVILTEGRGGARFAWKEIEESQGPAEEDCPVRILNLLSPTDNNHANDWRKRCKERAAKLTSRPSLFPGRRIEFETAFLTPEGPVTRFEVIDQKDSRFRAIPTDRVFTLKGWRREEYTAI